MKTHKYLAVLFAIVFLLTGCAKAPVDAASPSNAPEQTETLTPAAESDKEQSDDEAVEPTITCQYLPETLRDSEGLPVLKWVCLTERPYGGGVRTWNEEPVHALNQMLADRDAPFRVQFVLLTMDQWLLYSDWFSRPEAQKELADADLIYGMMTASDMQKYLWPITEYITGAKEPSLKAAVPHAYNWLLGTVDDQVYGIPTVLHQAFAGGWTVEQAFLASHGLTADSFTRDFWEMDAVFQRIYTENLNKPFLYIGGDAITRTGNDAAGEIISVFPGSIYNGISPIYKGQGACFAIEYAADAPTVVNVLQTAYTRQMQSAIARYKQAGYVTEDRSLAQLSYGTVFGGDAYTNDSGDLVIPNTAVLFHATAPGGNVSGISANSQYKAEALSLLRLIADDEEFRMHLFYGKEGRDYTVTDGYYTIKACADGSSYSLDFLSPLSYFSGLTADKMTANCLSPGTENWSLFACEGKDLLQTYREVLEGSVLTYSVTFDYSGFEKELTAMEAVYEKYFPEFSSLTEAQYGQMLNELEAAGSKKVLAALQIQLQKWQSANPNW